MPITPDTVCEAGRLQGRLEIIRSILKDNFGQTLVQYAQKEAK